MSAEVFRRDSEDESEPEPEPDPEPAPDADDPPTKRPKQSALIAAKELRRQLAAMKKRLAGKEAEAQALAVKLAERDLEMERRGGKQHQYVALSHRRDKEQTLWTSKASTWR